MKDLLSKAEIDSLLAHFRSEGAPEEDPFEPKEETRAERLARARISPADLFRPTRVPREQMQAIEHIFRQSAVAIAGALSEKLRTSTPCDCVAVEQVRFSSWISAHSGPVLVAVLDAKPAGTTCLLSVSAGMVHAMVDRALGGAGASEGTKAEFSDVELVVAENCLEPVLSRISEALGEIVPTELSVVSCHSELELAGVIAPQELVLLVHIQVTGQTIMGDLKLAIPYAPFEKHMPKAALGRSVPVPPAPGTRERLSRLVRDVKTELSVQLGVAELTLRELIGLRPGDVVRLERRFGEPVVAPVQGRPKFLGHLGKLGNRLAFRVGQVLANGE